MTDPIAISSCIQCRILTQYQTTQMISLDYVSIFELGPFSANIHICIHISNATLLLFKGECFHRSIKNNNNKCEKGRFFLKMSKMCPFLGVLLCVFPRLVCCNG